MNETTNETVVANKNDEQKVRFVIISQGQGGARIGKLLRTSLPNNPFQIAINTSTDDFKQIDLPDEQKFKIGGKSANGAGKNRKLAKEYYKNFSMVNIYGKENIDALTAFIGYYEEVLFHPTEQTIIISVFSSDGGTGSGLGPAFTATLANYINSTESFKIGNDEYKIDDIHGVPRPVVVGLVPRCKIDSGSSNLQNNIECFLDLQKWIDMGICNFFIADNNLPDGVQYKDTDEMYNIINARIVAPWVKFFGVETNSTIKCLDLQDKINVLRIPGCSSFTSITKENQFNYVTPRGQSVARTVLMLRHDVDDLGKEETAAKNLMNSIDVMSLDTMSTFFDLNASTLNVDQVAKDLISASMIGFFGYKSLNAIVEDLRDNERRLKVATQKKHNVMQEQSKGFSTVEKDAEELNDTFTSKVINHADLMDMI